MTSWTAHGAGLAMMFQLRDPAKLTPFETSVFLAALPSFVSIAMHFNPIID